MPDRPDLTQARSVRAFFYLKFTGKPKSANAPDAQNKIKH
ncbi:hypothetical protein C942_01389 [Photobacterium marinum]|uniref:Uncharacterized protein n=1 Tax=Photobacterium marinum TaxID=1056511 RepID=L8JF53_9GAMM|nr:hypothetical protein C942_01389 [Photobacterium marinum]